MEELNGLSSDELREETLKKMIEEVREKKRIVRGTKVRKNREIALPASIFDSLDSTPISLTNCPVTGHGCTENLMQYVLRNEKLKAFLAVPFDLNSWVVDPRRWIKNAMAVAFNIRCLDVDDFPNVTKILCKICSGVRQMPIGLFEMTELNRNVVFEFGMSTALGKHSFILVHKAKIPSKFKDTFPPGCLSNIEYFPYELTENAITKIIESKIIPALRAVDRLSNKYPCSILRLDCDHSEITAKPNRMFVALPHDDSPFFEEVRHLLENLLRDYDTMFFRPAKTLDELCQLCRGIRESAFCLIDTSFDNISMLFALGVAFGRDKRFIQLHDTALSEDRPMSDLRSWAIEYQNLEELEGKLRKELPKRLKDYGGSEDEKNR